MLINRNKKRLCNLHTIDGFVVDVVVSKLIRSTWLHVSFCIMDSVLTQRHVSAWRCSPPKHIRQRFATHSTLEYNRAASDCRLILGAADQEGLHCWEIILLIERRWCVKCFHSYHELSNKRQQTPSLQPRSWQRTDNVHRQTVERSVWLNYHRRQCESCWMKMFSENDEKECLIEFCELSPAPDRSLHERARMEWRGSRGKALK